MQINVTFRHTEPTEALKEYAEEKIRKLTKIMDRPQEVSVILSVEKIRHIAEVIIVADGLTITGKESTSDLYSAIDKVIDKIDRQLKKQKDRRKTRKSVKSIRTVSMPTPYSADEDKAASESTAEGNPSIVESRLFLPKPMTVEDAAVELAARKAPLVVFRNSATMDICVLHENSDGTLGLVEPTGI